MPRIPLSQRQVRDRVFQSRGVSARGPKPVNNLPAIQGVSQVVSQLNSLADQEKRKALDTTAKETENTLRNELNRRVYDPEAGFVNVKGKNAAESYKDVKDEYSKFVDQTIAGIGNEEVRSRLQIELGQTYKGRFDTTISKHAGREMEAYQDTTFKASLASIQNDAINGIKSGLGEGTSSSIEKMNKEIETYALTKGLDKKVVDTIKLENASSLHRQAINTMLADNQDLSAKEYFKVAQKNKEITSEDSTRISKLLEQNSILGESQRIAGEVMANPSITRAAALDEVAKATAGKDPKLVDEAKRRVTTLYNERKFIKEEKRTELFKGYGESLEQTKTLDDVKKTEGWLQLNMSERQSLEARERQLKSGKDAVTDPALYYKLKLQAADPKTQGSFKRMNLLEHRSKLGESDFKTMVNLQAGLLKGESDTLDTMNGIRSGNQIAKSVMKSAGISDEDDIEAFSYQLDLRVEEWRKSNNSKTIPSTEIKKLADDLARDVIIDDDIFFDDKKKAFKLELDDIEEIDDIEEVPEADQAQIREALKLLNQPVTEQTIIEKYKSKLKGNLR